jgi:hypothetical protein
MLQTNQDNVPVASQPDVLAEIEHLLESVVGRRTNQGLILAYLYQVYARGEESAKEHSIAIDALGRGPNFDPKREAIVRVEVHKLRRALKAYYSNSGQGRGVQIGLGLGKYSLVVERTGPAVVTEAEEERRELTVIEEAVVEPAAARGWRNRIGWVVLGAMLAVALLIGIRIWQPEEAKPVGAAVTAGGAGAGGGVRILAGLPGRRYVDAAGQEWDGDRYFTGGHGASNQSPRIHNTPDQAIYKGQREGDFTYEIPLPAGDYEVRAHFAETHYGKDNLGGGGESSRRFQVYINNELVLPALDVLLDAGGPNLALVKIFPGRRPEADGKLRIRFESLNNDKAFVNALEIVNGTRERMLPLRIAVGAPQVAVDGKGRLWLPDRYVVGGRTVERVKPVAGENAELYRFERFGRFEYSLPAVPGHQFQLKLWMAEQYFGVYTSAGSRPPRVFDLFCNGTALLRDFSILDAAGGPAKGVEKTFAHLTPDAQGNIRLLFTPRANYVALNAIELTDEGPVGRFR